MRKVFESVAGGLTKERIYLGDYEIYRERPTPGGTVSFERQTLHLMDDMRRVAMAETKTIDTSVGATGVDVTRWRFQLDNQIGSAQLELDEGGNVISYEEYHPFGSTAFHAAPARGQVSAKRYRYTGKERDEETGFYYHGARYYAPWLGRWTAADPRGGAHLYAYVSNNPVSFFDPDGKEESSAAKRFFGGLRVLGGAAQALAGGFVFVQVEVPVAAQVVGAVAVGHGLDDIQTGFRQLITGREEKTVTQQVAAGAARTLGASEKTSQAIGTGVDVGLGFVSPTGPASGGLHAVEVAGTGQRVLVATEKTAEGANAVKQLQQASTGLHAMTAAGAAGGGGSGGGDGDRKPHHEEQSKKTDEPKPASKSEGAPTPKQPMRAPQVKAPPKEAPKLFDIIPYSKAAPGFEKHHGVLDAWAGANIKGYRGAEAPTIVLTRQQHNATRSVFNTWRAERGWARTPIDWKKVSAQDIQDLTYRMLGKAGVPKDVAGSYIQSFTKYIYSK